MKKTLINYITSLSAASLISLFGGNVLANEPNKQPYKKNSTLISFREQRDSWKDLYFWNIDEQKLTPKELMEYWNNIPKKGKEKLTPRQMKEMLKESKVKPPISAKEIKAISEEPIHHVPRDKDFDLKSLDSEYTEFKLAEDVNALKNFKDYLIDLPKPDNTTLKAISNLEKLIKLAKWYPHDNASLNIMKKALENGVLESEENLQEGFYVVNAYLNKDEFDTIFLNVLGEKQDVEKPEALQPESISASAEKIYEDPIKTEKKEGEKLDVQYKKKIDTKITFPEKEKSLEKKIKTYGVGLEIDSQGKVKADASALFRIGNSTWFVGPYGTYDISGKDSETDSSTNTTLRERVNIGPRLYRDKIDTEYVEKETNYFPLEAGIKAVWKPWENRTGFLSKLGISGNIGLTREETRKNRRGNSTVTISDEDGNTIGQPITVLGDLKGDSEYKSPTFLGGIGAEYSITPRFSIKGSLNLRECGTTYYGGGIIFKF